VSHNIEWNLQDLLKFKPENSGALGAPVGMEPLNIKTL
jgi:hypothetical protein